MAPVVFLKVSLGWYYILNLSKSQCIHFFCSDSFLFIGVGIVLSTAGMVLTSVGTVLIIAGTSLIMVGTASIASNERLSGLARFFHQNTCAAARNDVHYYTIGSLNCQRQNLRRSKVCITMTVERY
jgi:hypothetical protein